MTTYTVIETNRNYEERIVGTYRTLDEASAAANSVTWAAKIVQKRSA